MKKKFSQNSIVFLALFMFIANIGFAHDPALMPKTFFVAFRPLRAVKNTIKKVKKKVKKYKKQKGKKK